MGTFIWGVRSQLQIESFAVGLRRSLARNQNKMIGLGSGQGYDQGRAVYLAKSGTLVFLASNMPALPPEKIYELWLIPTSGPPIPAGLFRPNAEGSGSVVEPPLPVGVEAKTFAITVEPKEGSPAPTSQPIMLGTRG